MKSIKTIAMLTIAALGAISTGVKPASALTGVDPHTGYTYDVSHCVLYHNAYVDNYGNVSCGMGPSGSSGYYYNQGENTYTQLDISW